MTRSETLSAAVKAVAEWRREAACNPAEQHRRHQVQLRFEALVAEIASDNGWPPSHQATKKNTPT